MKVESCILLALVILCLSGCSDPEPERTWRDDFTVQCKRIEESQFDDPVDAVRAIMDGTYISEQDEYTIVNKTNYVMKFVKVIFHVDMIGWEPFEFEEYIGTMKQGESKIVSVYDIVIMHEMGLLEQGLTEFPEGVIFNLDDCRLIRIEYEIEE